MMTTQISRGCLWLVAASISSVGLLAASVAAQAQTATYHLHNEASSTSGLLQLKTANPDVATVTVASANLNGAAIGEYLVKAFDTQTGIPNLSGVIPSGFTVNFTLWMKKSASSNAGTMFPRAKIYLNSSSGSLLCMATGSTAMTTTAVKSTLSCTTTTNIAISATDRFYLWVGTNVTVRPTASVTAQLNIEGTLNGNYDSLITVPLPTPAPSISSLSSSSGPVGASITITGNNFRSTQGTSTVTFNGVAATPSSWNTTSVVAPVPTGATTGPVVVTVGGQASNGVSFTVLPPPPQVSSLSPTFGPSGTAVTINGSNFGATQGSSTVTFNGTVAFPSSWSASSIGVAVPSAATTGPVVVTVGGQASNGVTFTKGDVYHLHSEASSTSGLMQLKQANPDVAATSTSVSMTNKSGEQLIKAFNTQINDPSRLGTIPSGSALSFTVWMRKSSSSGTMTPRAKVYLNSVTGSPLCTATTTTTLAVSTSTPTKYVLTCSTTATVTIAASDRLYLWTGVNITSSTSSSVTAYVHLEGTLNGNYDSYIVVPLPTGPRITSLSPDWGAGGTSVTITGTLFGETQGASTVTFDGVIAAPTGWSDTNITVSVPVDSTTGLVIVTVDGRISNGMTFTVVPEIFGLDPTSGAVGTPVTISGLGFGPTQGSSTVTFNGVAATASSWSSTSISVMVPGSATTGSVVVTVGGEASNEVTFAVLVPTISTLSPLRGSRGDLVTVNGFNFGSTQGSSTVTFNDAPGTPSSWSDEQIIVPVPSSATTGLVVVKIGGATSNGISFVVVGKGALTGTVMRTLDSTPVSGALVEVIEFGVVRASTITASQGGYSLSSLLPGTYDVRVTAHSFVPGFQTNIAISDNANTVLNVALNSGGTGALYRLHQEVSATSGLRQLQTSGPNASATPISLQVGSQATGEYLIQAFDTQPGLPSLTGTIPSGSSVIFTLWMKKSASLGTMTPRAKLFLNSASGIPFCTSTSASPLTVTQTQFTFTCTTTADISMSSSDRFYLWAGVNVTAAPGTNILAQLYVEGTETGATDSRVIVPQPPSASTPVLSSLSTTSGHIGTELTIRGTNFGSSQGSSTVTINGTAATPSSWTNTSITTTVPTGAMMGPVVVQVGGVSSNGLAFYVDDTAPRNITTVAGSGTGVFGGDNGPATSASLAIPRGVAMDGQLNLFIADSFNNRIRKVNTAGIITTVAGSSSVPGCCNDGQPAVNALLSDPDGVAPDRFGRFFIGDSNRIRKVETNTIISTAATGCLAFGVATDLQGNVFYTCRSTINKLDTGGIITTIAGTGLSGFSGDGGPAIQAQINEASGVAIDSRGSLYIADTGNHRIRKISPDGIISTVAGTGTSGFSGDSGPATSAKLDTPRGVAVDESGNLFIADTNNSRIRKVSPAGIIVTVAGNGVHGYAGDGGAAGNARLNRPMGIAVIGDDVLFIGDSDNSRIRKVGGGPFPTTPGPVITGLSNLSGPVGGTITISGANFGATQGTSTVSFNGTVATPTSWSNTSIVVPVPTGATSGQLLVAAGENESNAVTFTVIWIQITAPTPGAVLNQRDTIVMGRVPLGLGEVSVLVNGRPAMVSGQDFAVNSVALGSGTTVITATLTTSDGGQAQTNVSVNTTSQTAYVQVTGSVDQTLTPMSAQLTVDGTLPDPVTEVELQITGPSNGFLSTTMFPFTTTAELQSVGLYLVTATVTTTSGTCEGRMVINVMDPVSFQALVRAKWDGVKAAAAIGDIEGAVAYFVPDSQERYRFVFQSLGANLSPTLATVETVHLLSLTNTVAEAESIRTEEGITYSYPMTLRLDANGFWKFKGF